MIFPSQARKESMALAFAELDKVANPVICEVGRMRNIHAGESDGHSTLAFLEYVNTHGGKLLSVDKDADTENICVAECSKAGISTDNLFVVNDDAVLFFAHGYEVGNDPAYNFLYLDSWDLNDPDSAKQHILCFMLAERVVKPGGLVLIDDTGHPDLGKGKLIVPVAKLMGWTILHQGFQTLLRKP